MNKNHFLYHKKHKTIFCSRETLNPFYSIDTIYFFLFKPNPCFIAALFVGAQMIPWFWFRAKSGTMTEGFYKIPFGRVYFEV